MISIHGTTYVLISAKTLANGRTELSVRLPRGKKIGYAVVYENGATSEVVFA
jgi:hypothetical protein